MELKNHGQDILQRVDKDIAEGKIKVITEQELREKGVLSLFREYVNENWQLYTPEELMTLLREIKI